MAMDRTPMSQNLEFWNVKSMMDQKNMYPLTKN
jgi:hypothetical protein